MSIKKIAVAVTVACAAFVGVAVGQAVDPCSQNTQLTGGSPLVTTNQDGDQGMGNLEGTPFHYEIWFNKGQNTNPNYTMKWYGADQGGGAAFATTWNNSGRVNILARTGYYWGGGGGTYDTYKNIYCDYNFTIEGTGGEWSYFGIYGWSRNAAAAASENQLIEFYIVENWLANSQLGPSTVCGGQQCERGSFEIDGATYKIYTNIQRNQPSIDGDRDFLQVFSVRQYSNNSSPNNRKTCGSISITEHFKKWEEVLNLELGKLYEVKFKAETGGGTGSFDARYLTFSQEDFVRGSIPDGHYGLVTNVVPASAGTVEREPAGAHFSANSTVKLTAQAKTGWKFAKWEGDLTSTTNPANITMSENRIVTARFEPDGAGENLIKDGNFPSSGVISTGDGTSWKLGVGSGWGNSEASASVSNGNAAINVTKVGEETYQPQLVQYGLPLDNGMTYRLTFTAHASAVRDIEISFQQSSSPWKTYASKTVSLSMPTAALDYRVHTFEFKMEDPSDPNAQFAFNLGQVTDIGPTIGTVTISNVSLVYAASSSVKPDRHSLASVPQTKSLRVSAKKSAVSVKFKAKSTGVTELRLYGLKGDVVARVNINTLAGKSYAHTFSGAKLPNGVYVVSVQGNGAAERSRVVMPK